MKFLEELPMNTVYTYGKNQKKCKNVRGIPTLIFTENKKQ